MMTWEEIDESDLEDETVTMSEILEEFKKKMECPKCGTEMKIVFSSVLFGSGAYCPNCETLYKEEY